ncbi:MAG: OsmC family protein [Akkermansiaceae bacterium]|nr:OsmC family protein [Akkermansiaceae bacterium]
MTSEFEIQTVQERQFRCISRHKGSGEAWNTDIPLKLGGLGFFASPADTLAAAASSCMMSMMTFLAARKNIDLTGMKIDAAAGGEDGMIRHLAFRITVPLEGTHPLRRVLEEAAGGCPVRKSLHPDVEVRTEWVWK